jgi:phosphoglycerate dehydrogenase-like enzyme
MAHEWAMTAEAVLWRRSKLGLHLDAAARARWRRGLVPGPGAGRMSAEAGPIGILGAGGLGTALAQAAARAENTVVLWDRDLEVGPRDRGRSALAQGFSEIELLPASRQRAT